MSLPPRDASLKKSLCCPTDLGAIQVSGEDNIKFLQGQLTCDVEQLTTEQWRFGGHCDAKGKLWSVFRICWFDDALLLVQPRASIEASLAQLQKFAVFSKVEVTDASDAYSFQLMLDPATDQAPGEVTQAAQRLTLTLEKAHLEISADQPDRAPEATCSYWLAYEIEHGVPIISQPLAGEFVPQMVNLDKLGGISFKKGCYIGQETVARMHYLGQNKRALRLLIGQSAELPAPADQLERSLGDSWRRAGAVLSSVRYDNGEIALLAVLPADIEDDATLRIKGEENSVLTLCPQFDNQE